MADKTLDHTGTPFEGNHTIEITLDGKVYRHINASKQKADDAVRNVEILNLWPGVGPSMIVVHDKAGKLVALRSYADKAVS